MGKGRGGGKTPERVVELLGRAVAEKSQSAIARETGLTLLTVQRYIKGIGEPTTKTLQKLSDYFKVSVPWLRGEWDWTFEQERSMDDFRQLPDDFKNKFIDTVIEVCGGNLACQEENLWDEEKHVKQQKLKEGLKRYQDKIYRDLFIAFAKIPVEDLDDIMGLLQIFKESLLDHQRLKKSIYQKNQ